MDDINFLPPKETSLTSQENEILARFFSDDGSKPGSINEKTFVKPEDGNVTPSDELEIGWLTSLKISVVALVAFVILANPLVDNLINNLSFFKGNAIVIFLVKSVLFVILAFFMIKFLI